MTKFIVDIDEEQLNDATKKELEEIIKELKPGTIKMIYHVIEGNLVEFYVRANRKGDIFMGKPGLSEADKQWIAGLIRPISEDVRSLKEDVKVLKEDMAEVKNRLDTVEKDIKAIKECPTIKKELKNN